MDPTDELLILANQENVIDLNRVGELMDIINRKEVQGGRDFPALEAGKEYLRKMQELLDKQNQR